MRTIIMQVTVSTHRHLRNLFGRQWCILAHKYVRFDPRFFGAARQYVFLARVWGIVLVKPLVRPSPKICAFQFPCESWTVEHLEC
jgi:hypothetical protein